VSVHTEPLTPLHSQNAAQLRPLWAEARKNALSSLLKPIDEYVAHLGSKGQAPEAGCNESQKRVTEYVFGLATEKLLPLHEFRRFSNVIRVIGVVAPKLRGRVFEVGKCDMGDRRCCFCEFDHCKAILKAVTDALDLGFLCLRCVKEGYYTLHKQEAIAARSNGNCSRHRRKDDAS
jgi:hypothetical protein